MREVTKTEYMNAFKNRELKPIGSFSDPDGVLPFGYGRPAMDTDWGLDETTVARCEMRKEYRTDTEWNCTYYLSETVI